MMNFWIFGAFLLGYALCALTSWVSWEAQDKYPAHILLQARTATPRAPRIHEES
jgi:hypothetical protein